MSEKLASLLLSEGAVTPQLMGRVLARQREAGGCLDSALLELGAVAQDRLLDALSRASGLPPAPDSAFESGDPRARRVFPAKVAERHGLAPFALEGRELSVAACHPVDPDLLDEIGFMLSLDLRAHVALEWRVRDLIHRLYEAEMPGRLAALAGAAGAPAGGSNVASRVEASPPEPPVTAPPSSTEPLSPCTGPSPSPSPASSSAGADTGTFTGPTQPTLELRPPALSPEPAEPLVAALAQALEAAEADLLREPGPSPGEREGAARAQPPRWSLARAREALGEARGRDEVVDVALRYARDFFEFAALFAVTREQIVGYDAVAAMVGARARVRATVVPATAAGMFRTVIETGGPYLGPIARERGNDLVLAALGRAPRTALLYPVRLRDRTVCILYGDNGEAPVSPRRLGDFLLVASGLGAAFERILRERKLATAQGHGPAPAPLDEPRAAAAPDPRANGSAGDVPDAVHDGLAPSTEPDEAWRMTEPARAGSDLPLEFEVDLGEYEVGPVAAAGAAADAFDPIAAVEQLAATASGSGERGSLVAMLVQHGAAAAAAIAARLPGPVDAGAEGRPIYERGPLFAAAAALGGAATPSLVALLGDRDPERRRTAVLLLDAIADPAGFASLLDRLLDADPGVAAATRAVVARLRRRPEARPNVEKLRRALLSGIADRAVHAARVLGALRDAESIPLLIQLLEMEDAPAAAAAAQALSDITLQPLGKSPRRWLAWWKENRSAPRARWLLAALMHADREVRVAASGELAAVAPPPLPYSPDAPARDRERAARAWTALWERSRFDA